MGELFVLDPVCHERGCHLWFTNRKKSGLGVCNVLELGKD